MVLPDPLHTKWTGRIKQLQLKKKRLYAKYFGHMTKMAATPIYGKKPFKNILQNQKADDLGTWYVALGMWSLPSLYK